ncbi:MAG: fibronectin type III domain-containing protein, partial [Rhodospirillaceae bacterium]|nr:fibronectin type III domain-containing protein [Rhodospirillaceae bacterium]
VYQPWQTARELTEEQCGSSTSGRCGPPYFNTGGATLQFPVGGLTNGVPHVFRIRAVNDDGETISNEATTTPVAVVPAKPTGLTTHVDRFVEKDTRVLEWDQAADPSILRYEYTTDERRTWSLLTHQGTVVTARLPAEEFLSGYTFRIRAVNAAGPGPASEPAVDEEQKTETVLFVHRVSLEWDPVTMKATLVWDQTERTDLLWWNVRFDPREHRNEWSAWSTSLPIGTTQYEIPATFNAGDVIRVRITGCVNRTCGGIFNDGPVSARHGFEAGAPNAVITGFSATPGDAQVTLAWDDPMDSSITHYEYRVGRYNTETTGHNDIPDGDDAGSSAADETRHTVTTINTARSVPPNSPVVNGEVYFFQLRAANANGAGSWTEWTQNVIPLAAGVPAAPTGVVVLASGDSGLTTWDDPRDPSITAYQEPIGGVLSGSWQDIPGTDAATTGVNERVDIVRAVNANGVGPWARSTTVISPTPAQPKGLKAAPGNGRVTLTWNDPGRDVYIEFYRYTSDGGETWTEIPGSESTVQGQFTRYTVPNLTNGQAHTFAIQAENDSGVSPVSAAVTATPQGGAPAKPTGLSAAPGNAEVTLTWDNPHDASITGYRVLGHQVSEQGAAWAEISGSGAGTTSHTVTGLTNGAAYRFNIRAVNDHNGDNEDDPGDVSDTVVVTPGLPEAPASLVAAAGDAQVTLNWAAPASDNGSAVTGYEYTSNADAATPTWTDVPDSGSDGRADETE